MNQVELAHWKTSRSPFGISAGLSVVVHVALISASVVATLPAPDVPSGSLANRVYYIPPPNRAPAQDETRETLRFVDVAPPGDGAGVGEPSTRGDRPPVISEDKGLGNAGHDVETAVALLPTEGTDSVFTIVDVDTAAARLPESAAPKYPAEMLEQKIQGSVLVQFVVDTTGLADVTSFRVILASRSEFVQSVKDALPGMRFAAARIGAEKVRQLVELPFTFHIATPPPDTTAAATTAAARRKPQ